jgi:hypothetical protein
MNEKYITTSERKLPDIVASIRRGEWKIPRFQREFVWEKNKVIELLDSIYRQFPVGSFFLWLPPEDYARYYKDIPELQISPDGRRMFTHFILDGQQRLTSLYVTSLGLTINDFDYSSICFDLDAEIFNINPVDLERNIPVHKIFQQDFTIFKQLTEERQRAFMKVSDRLKDYPFPVITIDNKNIEDACRIFERINQRGTRLNIFDLVVALTWDKDFELKSKIDEFNKKYEPIFGKMEPVIFSETLSLVINKQATKAFQLQLTPEDVKSKWAGVEKAIEATLKFLRSNLEVRRYEYLPYRDMIPLIAYYFYECSDKNIEADKGFLEDWFWKATFSNRYSGAVFSKMGEDRANIFDRKLRGEPVEVAYDIYINDQRIAALHMGRVTAARNGILLLLMKKRPLSFLDNSLVDIEKDAISAFNQTEKHHIFPRAHLKSIGIKEKKRTDLLCNFCFIDSALNKKIGSKSPEEYLNEIRMINPNMLTALQSHLIPAEDGASILKNDYDGFLKDRSKLLYQEVRTKLGDVFASIEEELSSKPEKLIQRTEQQIRETIAGILYEAHGENWWNVHNVIPGDLKDYAKKVIEKERANKPYIPESEWNHPSRKLQQLNITHYIKIINVNWGLFASMFGSQKAMERNFELFSALRNQIDHVKTIDPTEREFGEVAIKWLQKCMRVEDDRDSRAPLARENRLEDLQETFNKLRETILGFDPGILEAVKGRRSTFNKENTLYNFAILKMHKKSISLSVRLQQEVKSNEHARKRKRSRMKIRTANQLAEAKDLLLKAFDENEKYVAFQKSTLTDKDKDYLDFWQVLLGYAKTASSTFMYLKPSSAYWLSKSAGISGISYSIVATRKGCSVELYLGSKSREANKNRFQLLQSRSSDIESAFGEPLSWEPLPKRSASRVAYHLTEMKFISQSAMWPEIAQKLVDKMSLLQKAIDPHLVMFKQKEKDRP